VVSPGFVFMLQRASSKRGPRLGITASRRVGNAAQRNRAKRLVREAFRMERSSWPESADVVVIVRQGLGNKKLSDVVAEWQAARGRIVRRFSQIDASASAEGQPRAEQPPAREARGESQPAPERARREPRKG
jgi:ribonuclease P protein component